MRSLPYNMEYVGIFLFVCCFNIGKTVFIKNETADFDNARSSCVLATPTVKYSNIGRFVELEPANLLGVNDSAWVGYVEEYEVFQFIGCAKLGILKRSSDVSNGTTIQRDIGQCQAVCRDSEYFGVKIRDNGKTACRCINVTNPISAERSIVPCETADKHIDEEFLLGINNTFAVYKIASSDVSNALKRSGNWETVGNNCTNLHKPNNNTYSWENCSKYYKFICRDSVLGDDASIQSFSEEQFGSWKNAAEACLREHRYLISYSDDTITDVSQFWTSNIRAFVVREVTETDRPSTFTRYGYIQRTGGRYTLHFGAGDRTLKSLCMNRTSTAITTSDEPIPKPSSMSGTYSTRDTITSTSEATKSTSDSGKSTSGSSSDAFVGELDSDSNSNVAVFVAVPLVIVILVVGVLVGLFVWRKRSRGEKSSRHESLSKQNLTYSAEDIDGNSQPRSKNTDIYNEINDIDDTANEDYVTIKDESDSLPIRNSVDNHSYFVLEKTQIGGFIAGKPDDYDYAKEPGIHDLPATNHTYHVLEKTQEKDTSDNIPNRANKAGYDYAKVLPKVGVTKTNHANHTIDTIEAEDDEDYDHLANEDQATRIQQRRHLGNDNDNDHVYNTTDADANVDTYDHVNNKHGGIKTQTNGTFKGYVDPINTYNKLKDVVNDNADTDMYNHINNGRMDGDDDDYDVTNHSKVKSAITDNPYDHTN